VQPELDHAPRTNNLAVIRRLAAAAKLELAQNDIVLLPERFHLHASRERYEEDIAELARWLGCHVVGGSHHDQREGSSVNSGIVCDSSGQVVGRYDKLRPYANERAIVSPGSRLGEVEVGSRKLLILICADFWFGDLFQRATRLPDLALVPALSVTRKPTPDYARALWRHLAISRAYELGIFIGISDWAHGSRLPLGFASGVAGFADPTSTDPHAFFRPVSEAALATFNLDFAALEAFRADRIERGFFWKMPESAPPRSEKY
jgi:predicted amidohydrolase